MDFGLWVEPEMVNPNSDLYRKHPDWVMNFTGRPRTEARQQLILNLARPEVKAYILQVLDKLLTENDIAFFKWDANRNWAEPGWPEAGTAERKDSTLITLTGITPSFAICELGIRRWKLNRVQEEADAWTSA